MLLTVLALMAPPAVASCGSDYGVTPDGPPTTDGGAESGPRDGSSEPREAGDGGDAGAEASDAAEAGTTPVPVDTFGDSLALWLDAADVKRTVDGVHVEAWSETWHANGVSAIVQGSPAPPAMVAMNGRPAIAFDGTSNLLLPDAPALKWGTGDFIFFAVMSYEGGSNAGTFWQKSDGSSGLTILAPADDTHQTDVWVKVSNLGGSGLILGGSWSMLHLLTISRVGTNLDVQLDAKSGTQPNAINDISASGVPVSIGGGGSTTFKGTVSEIIAARTIASAAQRSAVTAYLQSKYRL